MSLRPPRVDASPKTDASHVRNELEAFKTTHACMDPIGVAAEGGVSQSALAFEGLSTTEQSAASLGVHPDAFRPIEFMNTAHLATLYKENVVSDLLARRIEAYRVVASS